MKKLNETLVLVKNLLNEAIVLVKTNSPIEAKQATATRWGNNRQNNKQPYKLVFCLI